MANNPYQNYKNTKYETASQEQLLIMLYDGALKFGKQAIKGIEEEDLEGANDKLKRVQAIINELMVTLDREQGGEIAENLYNLYDYMNRRLIQANIRKDEEIIREVLDLLEDLKDGFEEAATEVKKQKTAGKQSVDLQT
jgi:flagellar protein FliS